MIEAKASKKTNKVSAKQTTRCKPSVKVSSERSATARVRTEMRKIAEYHYGSISPADVDAGNFLVPVGNKTREVASIVHKLHISSGQAGEDLARYFIDINPGLNRPLNLFGAGVAEGDELPKVSRGKYYDGADQTIVWSRLPKKEVERHVTAILHAFFDLLAPSERTTQYLEELIADAIADLKRVSKRQYESQPVPYIIDIAYETLNKNGRPRTLHLSEMKTGGELDPKNIKDAVGTAVRARLALLDYRYRVFVGAIQALEKETSRFQKALPADMFYKGEAFWNQITPDFMDFEQMRQMWLSVSKNSHSKHRLDPEMLALIVRENIGDDDDMRELIKLLKKK